MADKLVESPAQLVAEPPAGNRGGDGTYDGIANYPKRTGSPNGVPEKLIDGQGSLPKGEE
jgi:hypothetical protein